MSEQNIVKQPTKQKNKAVYYLNCAIVFLIMFVIGALPPFGQITPMGMKVLGVFLGVVYGWCTVGLVWPSIVGIIGIGSVGYCTITEAFAISFGDSLPLQLCAVYILGAYLEESGLLRYLSNWFVSRKIGEGRPWVFTFLIFLAAWVLASLVSVLFTIVIMWGIFYELCDVIGLEKRSKYVDMVMIGIVVISGLSGALFPFKPFSLLLIKLVQSALGTPVEVNFVTWVVFNTIISIIFTVCFMLVGRFIIRPDMTKVKEAGAALAYLRDEKMSSECKLSAVVFLLFLAALIIPCFASKEIPFVAWLNNAGILGVTGICMICLSIAKNKDGQPRVYMPKLMKNGINWEVVVLMAATMPMAAALESSDVGVMATIIPVMRGLFASVSPTVFICIVLAFFLIATQFLHNMVLMIVFIPVLATMGLDFGLNPIMIALLIYFAAMTAYLTPAASTNAALIFGNAEWINKSSAFFWGAITIVIAFIVLLGIAVPLGQIMF